MRVSSTGGAAGGRRCAAGGVGARLFGSVAPCACHAARATAGCVVPLLAPMPPDTPPVQPQTLIPQPISTCRDWLLRESACARVEVQHAMAPTCQTACRPQATCSEQWLRSSAPRCSSVRGWLRSRGTDSATLLPNRTAAGELSLRQPAPDRGEIDFLSLAAGATRGTQPCHRARLSKSLWLS